MWIVEERAAYNSHSEYQYYGPFTEGPDAKGFKESQEAIFDKLLRSSSDRPAYLSYKIYPLITPNQPLQSDGETVSLRCEECMMETYHLSTCSKFEYRRR